MGRPVTALSILGAPRLAARLARIGWEIASVEVDLCAETARVELRAGDRLVTFDARNGRATITREAIRHETAVTGRRGDRYMAERIKVEFIGRSRYQNARDGLRALSFYVADNSPAPMLWQSTGNLLALEA